jgi:hypothetical protein
MASADDEEGLPALCRAANRGDIASVELYLGLGLNVDEGGLTAILLCIIQQGGEMSRSQDC